MITRLRDLGVLAERCAAELDGPVSAYVQLVRSTIGAGRTIMWAGNGGSAAHAQHIATEYVVRYRPVARPAIAAIALSTDTSLITAAGNDLGYETVFARQVEAIGREGDLLVLVSTSGNSPNLLCAAEAARRKGVAVAALLARGGGRLAALVDLAVVVPTDDTALAQEIQLAIDHHVCELVEREFVK